MSGRTTVVRLRSGSCRHGGHDGYWHSEMVQPDEGLWVHSAAGRRQRRVRPYLRGRAGRPEGPREGGSHPPRAQGGQETGAARRLDPDAEKAGARAPSAAAPVLSSVSGSEISAISTLGLLPSARQAQKNAFAFKPCRSALEKRTMTVETLKTKPDKSPKTKAELEDLVLAELRVASGCAGARSEERRVG